VKDHESGPLQERQEENGDVARPDEDLGMAPKGGEVQVLQETTRAVPAPGAHDAPDAWVSHHGHDAGSPLGIAPGQVAPPSVQVRRQPKHERAEAL
jgi:hypothetical protein